MTEQEERVQAAIEIVKTQYCDYWEEPVLEVILPELERRGWEIERLEVASKQCRCRHGLWAKVVST